MMASRFLKALGGRIREMRKARGRSQERFAADAGLDRAFLGRVERGTQNVAMITAARIANAMEADLDELFRGLPRYDTESDEAPEAGESSGNE